ncbi:MAG: hypothetical protein JXX29_04790 [Deltaproteobacteria bacterium]|nr:hypothetical protein [Deltaproteobacteria bacterium]MBN2670963.1 hypothetical protein [Deltaproteobacteria bacterium]
MFNAQENNIIGKEAVPFIADAPRFGAHFGDYAHGIVVIPEEVSGVCEVRDRYDRDYVYQALYRGGRQIDTNDPVTLRLHLPFIRRARGHVLVTNVGLGGFLYRLLRKPGVVHITVVEPDYDVLELVEPSFSKFADKVTFVHGSVEAVCAFETFDDIYLGDAH